MSVTLKDIAKNAQVSIATVSKVINGKTSDIGDATIVKVQKIIDEMNYVPNMMARAMKTNRSYIIGLLIPDIRNPFFMEIARGAEDLAFELGYSLFLCNTDDDFSKESKHIQTLQELQIDGLIIAGSMVRNYDSEIQTNINVPLIAIDRKVNYKNVSSFITTNNFESSKSLVEELFAKGYRSFFYVGGPEGNSVAMERYEGTVAGLKDKEIDKFEFQFGRFMMQDGYNIIINKPNIHEFDVVICGNDLIAIGVLNALRNLGIQVPDQTSVIGFDDIELASSYFPKLSTIDQPTYEMGADAVRLLDKILSGDKIEPVIWYDQKLIFRDSTK